MSATLKRFAQESFMPVVLAVLAVALLLLYAEYRALSDAGRITVITVDEQVTRDTESADEQDLSVPQFSSVDDSDPRYQEAATLAQRGDLRAAERKYQAILGNAPSSRLFNDLAVLALKRGDRREALAHLNRALKLEPVYARAYFNRALLHANAGNTVAARKDYESLLKALPNHYEGHLNLGVLLMRSQDYAAAAELFARTNKLAGGARKARALYNQGLAMRALGRKPEARPLFEQAIRLKPDYIEPRFGLASLEDSTPAGRQRAMTYYETVFRLKPDYPPAYFHLAQLHADSGNPSAAEQAYRKAIQFNPQYLKARYNLGLLLLAQKRWNDARAEFEWVIKHDPQNAESYFNLARASYSQKETLRAIREYRTALDLRKGDYPEAELNLGLVYASQDKYADAEAAYRRALRLRPAYPEAWYNLGVNLLRQKKLDDARSAFETALRHDPRYEQAWFNLGLVHTRARRSQAAIDAYRAALAIRPDYPKARLNLAVRYADERQYANAVREYTTLLDADPTYATAWLNLGIVYRETGDNANAEHALRKLLELEPDNVRGRRILGQVLSAQGRHNQAIAVLEQAVSGDTGNVSARFDLAMGLAAAGRVEEARAELRKALELDPGNRKILEQLQKMSNSSTLKN